MPARATAFVLSQFTGSGRSEKKSAPLQQSSSTGSTSEGLVHESGTPFETIFLFTEGNGSCYLRSEWKFLQVSEAGKGVADIQLGKAGDSRRWSPLMSI